MTATVNVQVTFTWHADTNLPSDPPPPNVLVLETAGAAWVANAGDAQHPGTFTGSAKNDLGDPEALSQSSPYSETGVSQSLVNYDQNNLKGEHLTSYPASGGTVTIPKRTLTATATTTFPVDGQWYYGASVGVNYSAKIHPQPYNLRRQNFSGDTTSVHIDNGLLTFHYVWSSTSGSLSDLNGETIHENVACSVQTDNPPFLWQPPPLTDISVAADASKGLDDINSYGTIPGELVQDAFVKPYKVDHFTLTQSFLFNDPATMTTSDEQPIPGAVGPYQITNAVVADPGSPSGFSFVVTKDSVPSDPINLP